MRRATMLLGWLLATGCDLSDDLEGEPCGSDKDCDPKQECARTQQERDEDLPGVCAERGTECVTGKQLGCECMPDVLDAACLSPAINALAEYPAMICQPTELVCVLDPEAAATTEG